LPEIAGMKKALMKAAVIASIFEDRPDQPQAEERIDDCPAAGGVLALAEPEEPAQFDGPGHLARCPVHQASVAGQFASRIRKAFVEEVSDHQETPVAEIRGSRCSCRTSLLEGIDNERELQQPQIGSGSRVSSPARSAGPYWPEQASRSIAIIEYFPCQKE
jgi:hypothetical protein